MQNHIDPGEKKTLQPIMKVMKREDWEEVQAKLERYEEALQRLAKDGAGFGPAGKIAREALTETKKETGGEDVALTDLLTTDYLGMCPHCNGLVAIAKADTPQEEADALSDAAEWKRRGLDIYKRTHKTTDPMPHWCDRKCG